jgi:putative DNA primase/helicase
LFIHHAGNNGKQRGTSRREDALDTVIALRRPENYSPEQGARFEVHFEKIRNRADPAASVPFEARLESFNANGQEALRWSCRDLAPPLLPKAADLFDSGMTVRQVAAALQISKSEAGRLRLKAIEGGLIALSDKAGTVEQRSEEIGDAIRASAS